MRSRPSTHVQRQTPADQKKHQTHNMPQHNENTHSPNAILALFWYTRMNWPDTIGHKATPFHNGTLSPMQRPCVLAHAPLHACARLYSSFPFTPTAQCCQQSCSSSLCWLWRWRWGVCLSVCFKQVAEHRAQHSTTSSAYLVLSCMPHHSSSSSSSRRSTVV
jgi:hypothetical protein